MSGAGGCRSRVGVEGPSQLSGAANLSWCRRQRWRDAGMGGAGGAAPWASSSPAASTTSHDLGRLMGRGSPQPVFLLTGQGVIPGRQYGPLASTAQLCRSPGEKWWAFAFLKHSPLGKQGIWGNPCDAHRDQEADVLFISGGPLAVMGSSVPSPKQNPFPPQRSNFI